MLSSIDIFLLCISSSLKLETYIMRHYFTILSAMLQH